ncbi:protein kinase domain-containing protein [Nostoc sp.]|uniref:protein kinase domain-containing protein n=1 Tax=Nostoc sp. TaxID=1180 RepID=UPI002FF65860
MTPRIINDRYVLLPNIKSGGMADVHKAIDSQREGCQVAVKVFKHGQIEGVILAESFRRETEALKELKHPRIVELVDSGQDKQTGEAFLVLEWMDKDLSVLLKESPLEGWDSYWVKVGRPVLEALAFSHERQFVHRDVKPSNILIGSDGRVKLADFGISKLRGYFRPTVTLREFGSRPFTPPEEDDGSYPFTRDVFSFGVVALKCLTDVDLVDDDSVLRAMPTAGYAYAALDIPPEVSEIIQRAVSTDPAERQPNAEVLLAELDAVGQKRSRQQRTKKQTCFLKLTSQCLSRLQNELNISSEAEIQSIILSDLNGEVSCGIRPYKFKNNDSNSDGNHYEIYGSSYRYHVKVDGRLKNHLVVFNAWDTPHSQLEQRRELAWELSYEFRFGTPTYSYEGNDVIQELQDAVIEHEANLQEQTAEAEKQRIFRVWWDILRAKTDWEQKREEPIKYINTAPDGNRVIFQLAELPEKDITEQPRYVTNSKGISVLSGDVVGIVDDKLELYVRSGFPDRLPEKGELKFDTRLAENALNRQKSALDAIRYDRAVRSDLRALLVNAKEIKAPTLNLEVQFVQDLNESQKEVVRAALTTEDFLLVQGPPGTGKTTFITEVILQTLQQNCEARILLSSQTHVALDNALERIQEKNPNLKLIRIGNHERVAKGIHLLLLEEQMEKWRESAIAKGQKFLADWSARSGISQEDLEQAVLFQELRNIALKLEELRVELAICRQDKENKFSALNDEGSQNSRQKRKTTVEKLEEFQLEEKIEQLEKQAKEVRNQQKQKAEKLENIAGIKIEETLKMSPQEFEQWSQIAINPNAPNAKMLQQLINLQTEWFEQFGRNERFNVALKEIEQLQTQLNLTLASVPMQWLEMYEHRPLLEQALKDSQERLMIISPWIRAKSVNRWFLQQFENLLKRGVQVFIGYGLGEKDENRYPTDIQAEESLQKLARQYSKTFKLKRLGDTHAKILIVDTKFAVSTSFNWLSFKGERDRTFRDERGTLVSDPQKIDELFNNLLRRFTSD